MIDTLASLSVPSDLAADARPTALFAASLVHAIAHEEAMGSRPARITERGLATWARFRGRMAAADLVRLLIEDAAVLLPIPFDSRRLQGGDLDLKRLPESLAASWIDELGRLDLQAKDADYIAAQARLLGLTTRLAKSDLQVVKPHEKVLELPGTGGQLAHHLVTTQDGLFLQSNFMIACATWQEQVLAGLIALAVGAANADYVKLDPKLELAREETRRRAWDFVVGLAPEKGSAFEAGRLRELFPNSRILLV